MIIECTNCQSRFKVDESKIGSKSSKFKCSKCDSIIVVPALKKAEDEVHHSMFKDKSDDQLASEGGRKKKIIVADDTSFFREMLNDIMTKEGYEVIVAENGEEALNKVKHELPDLDLLLLDMLMPKMDGFAVISEIKKGAMGKDLPILALSGVFKSEEDRERMKELGVAGYIDKDTPPEDILRRVNMILRPEEIT